MHTIQGVYVTDHDGAVAYEWTATYEAYGDRGYYDATVRLNGGVVSSPKGMIAGFAGVEPGELVTMLVENAVERRLAR